MQYNTSYLRTRWSQFDLSMLLFHWISLLLHIYQLVGASFPELHLPYAPW